MSSETICINSDHEAKHLGGEVGERASRYAVELPEPPEDAVGGARELVWRGARLLSFFSTATGRLGGVPGGGKVSRDGGLGLRWGRPSKNERITIRTQGCGSATNPPGLRPALAATTTCERATFIIQRFCSAPP